MTPPSPTPRAQIGRPTLGPDRGPSYRRFRSSPSPERAGKTTTTRLVAHLAMTAGLTTAWARPTASLSWEPSSRATTQASRSPGGAGHPGLDIGVLETARGGMLLKGMG